MVDPDLQVAMDALMEGVDGAEGRLLALLLERRDGPAKGLNASSSLDTLFSGLSGFLGNLPRRPNPSNPPRPTRRRPETRRPAGPEWHGILPVE